MPPASAPGRRRLFLIWGNSNKRAGDIVPGISRPSLRRFMVTCMIFLLGLFMTVGACDAWIAPLQCDNGGGYLPVKYIPP